MSVSLMLLVAATTTCVLRSALGYAPVFSKEGGSQ